MDLDTLSDKIPTDKSAENLACCRKLCPPKNFVRRNILSAGIQNIVCYIKAYQNNIQLALKHETDETFGRTKLPKFRLSAENFIRRKISPPKILSIADKVSDRFTSSFIGGFIPNRQTKIIHFTKNDQTTIFSSSSEKTQIKSIKLHKGYWYLAQDVRQRFTEKHISSLSVLLSLPALGSKIIFRNSLKFIACIFILYDKGPTTPKTVNWNNHWFFLFLNWIECI